MAEILSCFAHYANTLKLTPRLLQEIGLMIVDNNRCLIYINDASGLYSIRNI